jgi:hypothetical protein
MVLLGFINDKDAKEIVGNSMVIFITFMILVCMLIASYDFLKQLYRTIKRWCLIKQTIRRLRQRKFKVGFYKTN